MWYLSTRPDAEARLVAELQQHLGRPPASTTSSGSSSSGGGGGGGGEEASSQGPSWQQLQACEYLGAVLRETLRVRPPVGVMARLAPTGATLAGYDVGGKVILASPFVLHRAAAWGHAPEAWRPERWLEPGGAADVAAAEPWRYMPFSRGPRRATGTTLAVGS